MPIMRPWWEQEDAAVQLAARAAALARRAHAIAEQKRIKRLTQPAPEREPDYAERACGEAVSA